MTDDGCVQLQLYRIINNKYCHTTGISNQFLYNMYSFSKGAGTLTLIGTDPLYANPVSFFLNDRKQRVAEASFSQRFDVLSGLFIIFVLSITVRVSFLSIMGWAAPHAT